MKHIHYDCIIAFANGEQIQRYDKPEKEWKDIKYPSWYDECKYRVKYKHQDCIDAEKEGKQIQFTNPGENKWYDKRVGTPFFERSNYRIKPTTKHYSFETQKGIDDILLYFDFTHVQRTMALLGWTWWNTDGTPTIKDLHKQARNLLETAAKNVLIEEYDGEYTTSSGGFCAVARKYENNDKIYLKLSFEIKSWDNWE